MSLAPKKPDTINEILIIEDDPALSAFMASALKSQGYRPTVYESHDFFEEDVNAGATSLDKFDLVVSDNTTGGDMNGVAFAAKYGGQKPIILCSAEHSAISQCEREGTIKGSILKPFTLPHLNGKVNEVANAIASPKEGRTL